MAQVGDHRRLAPALRQGVAGALGGVMGGGEGFNVNGADGEGFPRRKGVEHLVQEGDAVAQLPPGAPAGVDRYLPLLGQGGETGDVVGVFVGNEYGGQAGGVDAQPFQGGGDPAAGDAGVHQNVGVAVAHQQTVAAGAAGQGAQFQHKIAPFQKKQAGDELSPPAVAYWFGISPPGPAYPRRG